MPFIFIILEPDLILGRSSLQCSYFFIVNPFPGLMRETFRFGLLDCIGFCTSQRKFDSHWAIECRASTVSGHTFHGNDWTFSGLPWQRLWVWWRAQSLEGQPPLVSLSKAHAIALLQMRNPAHIARTPWRAGSWTWPLDPRCTGSTWRNTQLWSASWASWSHSWLHQTQSRRGSSSCCFPQGRVGLQCPPCRVLSSGLWRGCRCPQCTSSPPADPAVYFGQALRKLKGLWSLSLRFPCTSGWKSLWHLPQEVFRLSLLQSRHSLALFLSFLLYPDPGQYKLDCLHTCQKKKRSFAIFRRICRKDKMFHKVGRWCDLSKSYSILLPSSRTARSL